MPWNYYKTFLLLSCCSLHMPEELNMILIKKVIIDERPSGLMLGQKQSSTGVLENSISENFERFQEKNSVQVCC